MNTIGLVVCPFNCHYTYLENVWKVLGEDVGGSMNGLQVVHQILNSIIG